MRATTTPSPLGQYALLLLRVIVGIVFVAHGYPKFTTLAGTAGFFGMVGIPAPGFFAVVVAILETFGGLAMILGVLTRYVGVLLAIEMLVAAVTVKANLGLIAPMNRPGPPGYELDLTLLAAALVIAFVGPGALSLQRMLGRRR